jgi:methylmalonyl-CoA mutase
VLIPGARVRYLAEIAEQGRGINAGIEKQAEVADRAQSLWQALQELGDPKLPKALELYAANDAAPSPASWGRSGWGRHSASTHPNASPAGGGGGA